MLTFAAIALTLAGTEWKGYKPDSRFPYLAPALNVAYREQVLVGYPSNCFGSRDREPNRFEYAVAIHAVVQNGIGMSEKALLKKGNDVERASLLRFASTISSLTLAEEEFRPELEALGVVKEFGLTRLGILAAQIRASSPAKDRLFTDVLADHWAAKAIGDLRALEMLQGYGNGHFRR